jgi:glycosyltransferase involved in cell wall biosynthesis
LGKNIRSQQFEVVHLIHTYGRISLFLLYFLRKQNVIQTLHEVSAHDGASTKIDLKIFTHLVKKNIPIIFHSNTSKSRFLSFRDKISQSKSFDINFYAMIRFGLFETYKLFELEEKKALTNSSVEIPIILHFGRILPYKGIDILIEAVKLVQKQQPVHLIIAGSGDSYFSFEGIDSYEFINRKITNEEIISLIKKSKMVVCPYKSASQSGIPLTVFLYNKPIIASNVGAFKEIIDNNMNGILIDSIKDVELAEAILKLINNKNLAVDIVKNIHKKFNVGDEYSWPQIAKKTLNVYESTIK